jgi:hypothetical protein
LNINFFAGLSRLFSISSESTWSAIWTDSIPNYLLHLNVHWGPDHPSTFLPICPRWDCRDPQDHETSNLSMYSPVSAARDHSGSPPNRTTAEEFRLTHCCHRDTDAPKFVNLHDKSGWWNGRRVRSPTLSDVNQFHPDRVKIQIPPSSP